MDAEQLELSYPEATLFDDNEFDRLFVSAPKPTVPDDYTSEVRPANGEALQYTINKAHAYAVIDTLMEAYLNNAYPYNLDSTRVPQDPRHMPKTLALGTRDHAMLLFNTCYYMRGGIKSNDAFKRMSALYDDVPELFDCQTAQLFDEATIVQLLTEHGLGFQQTVAQEWLENSRRLQERFDGDPRKIFDGVDNYEQSLSLVRNKKGEGFVGFQKKMTSMILYFLMDGGLIDLFNFPPPVDLHVMRVSIDNEMIDFGNTPHGTNLYTDQMADALRQLYFKYGEEKGVDPLQLCNAVWMLSEALCGDSPGNVTLEPLGRKTRKGRLTHLIPQLVSIDDPAQRKAYRDSCGGCPIQETCEYNVPGKPYYVGANLIIRGRRLRFPMDVRVDNVQPTLF